MTKVLESRSGRRLPFLMASPVQFRFRRYWSSVYGVEFRYKGAPASCRFSRFNVATLKLPILFLPSWNLSVRAAMTRVRAFSTPLVRDPNRLRQYYVFLGVASTE